MKNWLITPFLIAACAFQPILAQELLKASDVHKIMNEMFEEHLDKKSMSTDMLKNSLRMYVEQFDPMKVYLLQSEVNSLINPTDAQIKEYMQQYKNNDYSVFENMNKLFDQAILRARKYRKTLEAAPDELFAEAKNFHLPAQKFSESENINDYAKNISDLQERQKKDMLEFIVAQSQRYGSTAVQEKKTQVITMYERQTQGMEDRFMFADSSEPPLDEEHREHKFYLNVLKALARSLDAHSSFFDDSEAYDMRVRLEKDYVGIGVGFKEGIDGFTIGSIVPDSPADKSNLLKIGDKIISIDGQQVANLGLSDIGALARGDEGSLVTLVIQRAPEQGTSQPTQTVTVKLKREKLEVNDERVKTSFIPFANGIIGVIRLDAFYQNDDGISSEKDVKDAILKLQKEGSLLGLILDLRENGGGYLSQAVKVAGLFITDGVIVMSKYSDGEKAVYRDVDAKAAYTGPLVVLTSKLTASAAEIVSQALQDYGVALVVGDSHTYGKGSIQTQTVTDGHSSSYFKVTVGQYYTVSGKSPQKRGVIADVVVPSRFTNEEIGEEYLDLSLPGDKIEPAFNDKLDDIQPAAKSWYLKYYLPHLQQKTDEWTRMLPTLKKNSEYRIAHNKNYQLFFKKIGLETAETKQEEEPEDSGEDDELNPHKKDKDYGEDDLQLREAENVVKDMIILQGNMEGHSLGAPK